MQLRLKLYQTRYPSDTGGFSKGWIITNFKLKVIIQRSLLDQRSVFRDSRLRACTLYNFSHYTPKYETINSSANSIISLAEIAGRWNIVVVGKFLVDQG
ncbi:MAG: hypothetical protein QGI86_21495 [Candidatus Poribacteria bacterium]|nr:hypothetical protein [Candidatus Poribacteria bacterium]MDP6749382.1 hypothetical protein [Candidatus Poribacteria bacterium]MDP6995893.1 hypothetical protein [Candidatus Poribacteria bacterium]